MSARHYFSFRTAPEKRDRFKRSNIFPVRRLQGFGSLVVLASAAWLILPAALAQDPCTSCTLDPCGPCDSACSPASPSPTLFSHKVNAALAKRGMSRIKVFGWIQAGGTVNEHGSENTYKTTLPSPAGRQLDYDSGNSFLLGTEQQSDFKLSQLWLGATRTIEAEHGLDWGFRFDSVYGTDARYCQSFGDGTFDAGWGDGDYYVAFTQMYLELGNKKLKARVGKFVTDMSFEPIAAPATYFYSHSYACYSSPLHVSGAAMEYALTKKLTFFGAWTAGYHTSFENRFEDNGFFGKLTYRPTKNTAIAYNLYTGTNNGYNKNADAGLFGRDYRIADVLAQTVVFTWKLNGRWRYMIEGHWAAYDYKDPRSAPGNYSTYSQGISQHIVYTINTKWSVGARIEWLDTKGDFFDLAPYTGGDGMDVYEVTLGANWHPVPWLNVRPEIRYDWTDYANGFRPFDKGTEKNQLSAGLGLTAMF